MCIHTCIIMWRQGGREGEEGEEVLVQGHKGDCRIQPTLSKFFLCVCRVP